MENSPVNRPHFTAIDLVPRTHWNTEPPIPRSIERNAVQHLRFTDMLTVRKRIPENREPLRRESELPVNNPTCIRFSVGGDQIRHVVRRKVRIIPTARTNEAIISAAARNDARLRAEHLGEPVGRERRVRREDEFEIFLGLGESEARDKTFEGLDGFFTGFIHPRPAEKYLKLILTTNPPFS